MVVLRLFGAILSATTLCAQEPTAPVRTTLPFNAAYDDALQLRTLVKGGTVVPNWLDDHRFWFEDAAVEGPNTFLVDAATNTKVPYRVPGPSHPNGSPSHGISSPDGRTAAF